MARTISKTNLDRPLVDRPLDHGSTELVIGRGLLTGLERQALSAAPEECCGLLIGRAAGPLVVVEEARGSPNVHPDDRTRHYEIDPEMAFEILWELRGTARQVAGFYHSHPVGTTEPSAADAEGAWLGKVYLILGVQDGAATGAAAWRMGDERSGFDPVVLRITESSAVPSA